MRVERAGLQVASVLADFVERRALPGTGLEPDAFWRGVADIFARFVPENRALLAKRDELQDQIDAAYRSGKPVDEAFLRDIGYLVNEPAPFAIGTENVDVEIAETAGPQLVVPSLNARFLLNAANARWGSLYDALYGTDAIPGAPEPGGYDQVRGAQVIGRARTFLDEVLPGWAQVFAGGEHPNLVGWRGDSPLFRHNGLHIELLVDRQHPVGRDDPNGVADVLLEAAITAIVDLEDSVAAVDADDKVAAYANWLGLLRGDLEETFEKGGRSLRRRCSRSPVQRAPPRPRRRSRDRPKAES